MSSLPPRRRTRPMAPPKYAMPDREPQRPSRSYMLPEPEATDMHWHQPEPLSGFDRFAATMSGFLVVAVVSGYAAVLIWLLDKAKS